MILPINHVADWRYICQLKQKQINKDVIGENTTKIDHDYRVVDKVTTNNRPAYKYENMFRGPYETVQTWTNSTVKLRTGAVKHRISIRNIKPYNDTGVE